MSAEWSIHNAAGVRLEKHECHFTFQRILHHLLEPNSKHKGLDDKKCEALLLDSLKDHGSLTKPEIVRLLWDVLPDQLDDKQREYKMNNLLRKL